MTIENYPLWPFEPNWNSDVTETLNWLTDVMTSPTGSEQRRSLRHYPRRNMEFSIDVYSSERTLYDNLTVTYGARRFYVPLWWEVDFSDQPSLAGTKSIACSTVGLSKLKGGTIAVLLGDTVFDYELIEIDQISSDGFTVKANLSRLWPSGTRIYPVTAARFVEQPEIKKRNDRLASGTVGFQSVDSSADTGSSDTGLNDAYRGFTVLPIEPNEREDLTHGMERMLVELDNQTSIPVWQDTALRVFSYQQYGWLLQGRREHRQFENLLQKLRGRAVPIWLPTYMEDFQVRSAIKAIDKTIQVERAGFTIAGGPRPDRQDIMIELLNGSKFYRRITDSAVNSLGQETLVIDSAIGQAILPSDIVRVCFITLMRLNQDTVEISHQTDSDGVATALVTFRSAPDTRIATPALL